jgi:hypothetical protein
VKVNPIWDFVSAVPPGLLGTVINLVPTDKSLGYYRPSRWEEELRWRDYRHFALGDASWF